jgi:AraC family transcriptional regulator
MHARRPKSYRDPTIPRRVYLPARVRLRGVSDVLELAASRHLGLADVAAMLEVSPDHLLRLFRECGYPSPMRQVRRLNLARAAETLRTTHASLETLAEEFGYADGSSLRRALRRAFGLRLGELREGGAEEGS